MIATDIVGQYLALAMLFGRQSKFDQALDRFNELIKLHGNGMIRTLNRQPTYGLERWKSNVEILQNQWKV